MEEEAIQQAPEQAVEEGPLEQAAEDEPLEQAVVENPLEEEDSEDLSDSDEENMVICKDGSYKSIRRVYQWPIMTSAVGQLQNAYLNVKTRNNFIERTLDTYEYTMKTMAEYSLPIVHRLDRPIGTFDEFACSQINFLESQFPYVKKPTAEVLNDGKTLYNYTLKRPVDKVVAVKDAGVNMVSSTTRYGIQKVTSVKNYTVEKLTDVGQAGLNTTNHALCNYRAGQLVVAGLDKCVGKVDNIVDYCLVPEDDEEPYVEEMKIGDTKEPVQFVYRKATRVGGKICRRSYKKALRRYQKIEEVCIINIRQLKDYIDLVAAAKTVPREYYKIRNKIYKIWAEGDEELSLVPSESTDRKADEIRLMATIRQTILRLKSTIHNLYKISKVLVPGKQIFNKLEQLKMSLESMYFNFAQVELAMLYTLEVQKARVMFYLHDYLYLSVSHCMETGIKVEAAMSQISHGSYVCGKRPKHLPAPTCSCRRGSLTFIVKQRLTLREDADEKGCEDLLSLTM